MRKILTTICVLIVTLLLPLSFFVSQSLPIDTAPYISKKYAGWNGVLQAWVCCEWDRDGNIISWLNRCSSEFEKAHEGVYLELTNVDRNAMVEMLQSGIRKPELIFFSPGVLSDSSALLELAAPDALRDDLRMDQRALPVVMGGYIFVYNPLLTTGAPNRSKDMNLIYPANDRCRDFSLAALSLLSGDANPASTDKPNDSTARDELDLGLPSMARSADGILQSDDAINRFIAGELPCTIVSQREISKLAALRDTGRAPDWKLAPAGDFAWVDQLLYVGAVSQSGKDADARAELAADFLHSLFLPDAQKKLGDLPLCSVTGNRVHSNHSPYAPLEDLLLTRPILAAHPFSEYSHPDSGNIVRDYCAGRLTLAQALSAFGLNGSLPIYPN